MAANDTRNLAFRVTELERKLRNVVRPGRTPSGRACGWPTTSMTSASRS